jgi:hypothetical protein
MSFLVAFVVNSIAGAIITDLSKTYVPFTEEIKKNKISLRWGFRKMLQNNLWWRCPESK